MAQLALPGLLELRDSLVILDHRDSRVSLDGLAKLDPLVKQETQDGLELQVRKVSKDPREQLDSRDRLELLGRLVHLDNRDSLEVPAHRVSLVILDSLVLRAHLVTQVINYMELQLCIWSMKCYKIIHDNVPNDVLFGLRSSVNWK